MSLVNKFKRAARGKIKPTTAALEVIRRSRVSLQSWNERASFHKVEKSAPMLRAYSRMKPDDLLTHYQLETTARFFNGFCNASTAKVQQQLFPDQTAELLAAARRIVAEHCWSLLGFGEKCFGRDIAWTRDPLSGHVWPPHYHREIELMRSDGSDARVVWELNRLGHLVTLGRAYAVTNEEFFAVEFLAQLRRWSEQNPLGRGVNWTCAMEVALRAMNLLAAFQLVRRSRQINPDSLSFFLRLLQQHGTYIRRNLEFSYIATSNHYLSDVVGLLWLGLMLPEFRDGEYWRDFGKVQMLREMDKQVLPDGADFESSTGYHRFVLELFLYSFILCRANKVEIDEKYWRKLHQMLVYLRAYLRPDGLAPLIGDSDSGQVLPIRHRRANDHAYLLAVGAVLFNDPSLKPEGMQPPEELLWILGEDGVEAFQSMGSSAAHEASTSFPEAGTYVMREADLYLCFNASGAGVNGRGSHGHNDALSIEVSATGRPFIVDPGTYVYSANLRRRHEFRSTAYHSTVRIDNEEQNTTDVHVPFAIGDEAHPRVLLWESNADCDKVVAEHYGYTRLPAPITHRRSVTFDKKERWWLIEDEFFGEAEHDLEVRFHFAPGLQVRVDGSKVVARDEAIDTKLAIVALGLQGAPVLEDQATSSDYGEMLNSVTACWRISGRVDKLEWKILRVRE